MKLDINILNKLTNNEAAIYFAIAAKADENNEIKATVTDIVKTINISEATFWTNIESLINKGAVIKLKCKRSDNKGIQNYYKVPINNYMNVNPNIVNEDITLNQLGVLLKLKANTLIGTNIIPFSLNKIVKKVINVQHNTIYHLIEIGLLEKYEDIGFRLLNEDLFPTQNY